MYFSQQQLNLLRCVKKEKKLLFRQLLIGSIEDQKSLAFLTIDIDHFKKINDTFGHIAGDEILREFGNVLVNTFRDILALNEEKKCTETEQCFNILNGIYQMMASIG